MNYFCKSLLLTAWALGLLNSCRSNEDDLPAPTTEGLNTFGCKINGKPWIADGVRNDQGPAAKAIEVEYKQLSDSTFYLLIHTNASTKDRVQLSIPKGKLRDKVFDLEYRNDEPFAIYYDSNFRLFTSRTPGSGKITFTRFDPKNHVVSGMFEFTGEYIVDKSTVRVTEGRFDINMENL